MEVSMSRILHCVVLLCSIQYCSAYCYGYCWYGSWYIWFSIIMVIAICCGALGSYFRRRQIRRAMRNRQQMITVQVTADGQPVTSDRPYVYPHTGPGAGPPPPPGSYPTGNVPYPAGPYPPPANGAPYPPSGAPYSPSGAPYSPSAPYPMGGWSQPPPGGPAGITSPPPYAITEKDKEINALPPTYQDAVRSQGYDNHGATIPEASGTISNTTTGAPTDTTGMSNTNGQS